MNRIEQWAAVARALGNALNLNAFAHQPGVSHNTLWRKAQVILAAGLETASLLSVRLDALNKSVHLIGLNRTFGPGPPAQPQSASSGKTPNPNFQ